MIVLALGLGALALGALVIAVLPASVPPPDGEAVRRSMDCFGLTPDQRANGYTAALRGNDKDAAGRPVVLVSFGGKVVQVQSLAAGCEVRDGEVIDNRGANA